MKKILFRTSLLAAALLGLVALLLPAQATAQTRQEMRDSLEDINDQLQYHPDSVGLLLRKAGWNIQMEQWQYALNTYDNVLRIQPKNIAGLYYRAFVNDKLHRYNYARADYETLLEQIPNHFEAQIGLALVNQKDRHFTEALDGMNRLVADHPDSAIVWAIRAGMEVERGMYELAEYDYGTALSLTPHAKDALAPQFKDYLLARADVRIRLRRYREAREDLDALVRLGTPRAALRQWYHQLK